MAENKFEQPQVKEVVNASFENSKVNANDVAVKTVGTIEHAGIAYDAGKNIYLPSAAAEYHINAGSVVRL